MSEQVNEQQVDQAQAAAPAQAQPQSDTPAEETFPLKLIKRETGDTHWNVASGIWEKVVHAETGEPNSEYALIATIDGVDVTLETFNSGGIETIIRSAKQAQQQNES